MEGGPRTSKGYLIPEPGGRLDAQGGQFLYRLWAGRTLKGSVLKVRRRLSAESGVGVGKMGMSCPEGGRRLKLEKGWLGRQGAGPLWFPAWAEEESTQRGSVATWGRGRRASCRGHPGSRFCKARQGKCPHSPHGFVAP